MTSFTKFLNLPAQLSLGMNLCGIRRFGSRSSNETALNAVRCFLDHRDPETETLLHQICSTDLIPVPACAAQLIRSRPKFHGCELEVIWKVLAQSDTKRRAGIVVVVCIV